MCRPTGIRMREQPLLHLPSDRPDNVRLLEEQVTACTSCPRLVAFLEEQRRVHPDWWNRPVPGFGDPRARVVVLGLAPGRAGANRTGRPFTGDAAGEWLYRALYEHGFANRPTGRMRDDGLKLRDCCILNAVKCVPPGNRPTGAETTTCSSHLLRELAELPDTRLIVALGKVAHEAYLRARRRRGDSLRMKDFPFGHGRLHTLPTSPRYLLDSYHPSRQNTNTGKLTWEQWSALFIRVREIVRTPGRGEGGTANG